MRATTALFALVVLIILLAPLGLGLWLDARWFAAQDLGAVFALRIQTELVLGLVAAAIAKHRRADDLAVDLLKFLGTPRRAPIESEVFVHTRAYGTRSSTVILVDANKEVLFVEQNYTPKGARDGDAVRFRLPSPN